VKRTNLWFYMIAIAYRKVSRNIGVEKKDPGLFRKTFVPSTPDFRK